MEVVDLCKNGNNTVLAKDRAARQSLIVEKLKNTMAVMQTWPLSEAGNARSLQGWGFPVSYFAMGIASFLLAYVYTSLR